MKGKKYDITKTFLTKKIFLNTNKTKWCFVKLYNFRYDMQQDYEAYNKERGFKDTDSVLGASCHYEKLAHTNGSYKLSGETGIVFLCVEHCGAAVVAHELLHATLWAWKHKRNKPQYPIVIKNMKEEETVLHNMDSAIAQFYVWFWKVVKETKG